MQNGEYLNKRLFKLMCMILATVVCVVCIDELEQRHDSPDMTVINAISSTNTSISGTTIFAGIGENVFEDAMPSFGNMIVSFIVLCGACAIVYDTYSKRKELLGYGNISLRDFIGADDKQVMSSSGKKCDAMTLNSIVESLRVLVQDEELPDKFRGAINTICGNVSKLIVDDETFEITSTCVTEYGELPQVEYVEIEEPKISKCDEEFLNRLTKLIEENMNSEKLDMEFMTDKLNMSHSTFYRKVKSLTGYTAVDFIRKVKLRKSVELLKANKYTISEISYMTGFNSPSHFRQAFKDEYKIPPSQSIKQSV